MRKIIPEVMLAAAAQKIGIKDTDKVILEVQLDAQARLQETIDANAKGTEQLTKRLGIASLIIGLGSLVISAVGVYVAYVASELVRK